MRGRSCASPTHPGTQARQVQPFHRRFHTPGRGGSRCRACNADAVHTLCRATFVSPLPRQTGLSHGPSAQDRPTSRPRSTWRNPHPGRSVGRSETLNLNIDDLGAQRAPPTGFAAGFRFVARAGSPARNGRVGFRRTTDTTAHVERRCPSRARRPLAAVQAGLCCRGRGIGRVLIRVGLLGASSLWNVLTRSGYPLSHLEPLPTRKKGSPLSPCPSRARRVVRESPRDDWRCLCVWVVTIVAQLIRPQLPMRLPWFSEGATSKHIIAVVLPRNDKTPVALPYRRVLNAAFHRASLQMHTFN